MVQTRQDRCNNEVRICISPRNTMLHSHIVRSGERHPQGERAVIKSPGWIHRHIKTRPEAPIRVSVGRKNGHAFGHYRRKAANGMSERVGNRWLLTVRTAEDISALVVKETDMDVQATAGDIRIQFRHETGGQAMFTRYTFDEPPQQYTVIASQDGVVYMMEIDLELAW